MIKEPPNNVVDLNDAKSKKESGQQTVSSSIWICDCDCITFRLHDNEVVVCAQCGAHQPNIRAVFKG